MIDTKARKYINKPIDRIVKFLDKRNVTPTQVTVVALVLGIISAIFFYFDYLFITLTFLWLSGLCDVIDGALARFSNKQSKFGTVLDITFDRIVECSIILVIALKHPEDSLYIVILLIAILLSMTIFLSVGAMATNDGKKSFKYQTGLGERTEGFILLSIIIIFPKYATISIIVFIVVVVITIIQRIIDGYKVLK